ncbi:myeloid-associated differentiation marker-like isoform X2 [Bos javanicus]|uniref:myeloid-associated differentiation marker-like isoform X2 n=1 Tax=Bos javanicus TaxID=9906 RepID=UPI002AA89670|nr:myeloid-associated differentiation marker-like isoform X2 [Bos javanicus]
MGYFLRTLQLLSTCVAISLVGSLDSWTVPTSTWSFVILCFCCLMTLIILIIESLALQYRFSFSWGDFLLCHACYLALFCLLVSIIYPTTYVQFLPCNPSRDRAIAATAFCFISTVSYATEAIWILGWPRTGDFTGYIGSLPFFLKMLETLVACVILPFISNPYLYMDHPLLVSCVAVYSICFILGIMTILLNLANYENWLPISSSMFHLVLSLLSVLLYIGALVLWPLYQFDERFGGQPERSRDVSCQHRLTNYVCIWDQRLAVSPDTAVAILSAVAILTAINLLIYVADLVYWAHHVSVGTEDQPGTPDHLCSQEDGRVEGCMLIFSCKNSKIATCC